jgi:hypothetical protein
MSSLATLSFSIVRVWGVDMCFDFFHQCVKEGGLNIVGCSCESSGGTETVGIAFRLTWFSSKPLDFQSKPSAKGFTPVRLHASDTSEDSERQRAICFAMCNETNVGTVCPNGGIIGRY